MLAAFIFVFNGVAMAGSGWFYYHSHFKGKKLRVAQDKEYAHMPKGWNDKISSYIIDPDTECVVTKNSKFGGGSMILEAGTSAEEMPSGWNDKFSSIKCAKEGYFTTAYESAAYEHAHYAGKSLTLTHKTYIKKLSSAFNDKISSVRIKSDAEFACDFYKDKDFKHQLFQLTPGRSYERLSEYGYDNKISSIKCYSYDQ
ncbi:beta/gamma crystallin-related protein [Hippea sp. KM1]|uniref:beta/gamma crystallin-related protein n=1 Tax=Hippea sp. KM1 TaxID=944481 RepID=UPI0004B9EDF0|nr:beta/gamma crystallin-related protein [Hippea sp. KM1]